MENNLRGMLSSRSALSAAFCSIALACVTAIADAETNPQFTAHWMSSDDQLEINIQSAAFKPEDHKIELRDGKKYVDGIRAIGIDGTGRIETEIKTFTIVWKGKSVLLPEAAYAPLFNFSVQKASYFPGDMGQVLAAKSSADDALLFIFANGSTSVRQWVWLVVTRDGRWFRFEGGDGESPL